ncbi:MAG: hypothetical protein AB7S71_20915 [Dongiaceae bacterium]
MAITWNKGVKRAGRLKVYADPSLKKGAWGALLGASIREFNRLAKGHKFGVTLEETGDPPVVGGGADVSVATADGQITFKYDGLEERIAFDGARLHGRTRQVRRDDGMEKAYIFLPAMPLINTPTGRRPVGPEIMKLIAVHEFVHACGLTDAEHSSDDLFQGNPNVDYGQNAARDRAMGRQGNKTMWMPPLFLSAATARRVKDNWS